MGFKFNSFELGTTSQVLDATDTQQGMTLDIMATAADRRALQQLFANAGRVQSFTMALGEELHCDPTGGLNTFYVSSAATTQVDSGWFACRTLSDQWQQRTTHARMRVDLVRLAGDYDAAGESNGLTTFLTHDF